MCNHHHLSTSTHHFHFNSPHHLKLSFSHLGLVLHTSHSSHRVAKGLDFDIRWLDSQWGYWDNREEAEKSEITQIELATDQLSDLQISEMREMQEDDWNNICLCSMFKSSEQRWRKDPRIKNFTGGNHPKI